MYRHRLSFGIPTAAISIYYPLLLPLVRNHMMLLRRVWEYLSEDCPKYKGMFKNVHAFVVFRDIRCVVWIPRSKLYVYGFFVGVCQVLRRRSKHFQFEKYTWKFPTEKFVFKLFVLIYRLCSMEAIEELHIDKH